MMKKSQMRQSLSVLPFLSITGSDHIDKKPFPIPLLHEAQRPSGLGIGVAVDSDHADFTGSVVLFPLEKRNVLPVLGKRDRIVYQHLCRPLADPVIGGTAKHHILVNVFVKTQFSFHMYLSSLACFLLFSLCITNCPAWKPRPLPRASARVPRRQIRPAPP